MGERHRTFLIVIVCCYNILHIPFFFRFVNSIIHCSIKILTNLKIGSAEHKQLNMLCHDP